MIFSTGHRQWGSSPHPACDSRLCSCFQTFFTRRFLCAMLKLIDLKC